MLTWKSVLITTTKLMFHAIKKTVVYMIKFKYNQNLTVAPDAK